MDCASSKTSLQLPGIDLLKWIMSFAVVAIHLHALNAAVVLPISVNWFIHLAVPFFFMASGFLIARQTATFSSKSDAALFLRSKAIRLFKTYLCWAIIYLPLSIFTLLAQPSSASHKVLKYFFGLLIGNVPMAWPLWYLFALALFLLVFSYLQRQKTTILLIFTFSAAGYALNISFDEFTEYRYGWIYSFICERLIGSGIFILGGMIVHHVYQNISRLKIIIAIISLILSVFMMQYSVIYWEWIGGVGIFLTALTWPASKSALLLEMRHQSIWIYYIHIYILIGWYLLSAHFGLICGFWTDMASVFIINWIVA